MRLRRLSSKGTAEFQAFLDSLTQTPSAAIPSQLLGRAETSEGLEVEVEVEPRVFPNRFAMAKYLDSLLGDRGLKNVKRDVGLWSWLALFYFDQLCPAEADGRRKAGDRARYIPAVDDYRKYYRHLLAGPYSVFRAHRDDPARVLPVLAGPPSKPGEIAEQLTSRQEIVTNKAIMGLAATLYIDTKTQRPKRGAGGSGPGSARRFADILNQFDLTWDLYSMETAAMKEMMPAEFGRFIS